MTIPTFNIQQETVPAVDGVILRCGVIAATGAPLNNTQCLYLCTCEFGSVVDKQRHVRQGV